jgi:AcrR family transcriptional regulator
MTNINNRLIAAAITTLADKGLNGFSMSEVAYRADVSEKLIKHHYHNEESLILAVVDDALQHCRQKIFFYAAIIGHEQMIDHFTTAIADYFNDYRLQHKAMMLIAWQCDSDKQPFIGRKVRTYFEEWGMCFLEIDY